MIFQAATVRIVAAGVDGYPNTFLLDEKPESPIKPGLRLRLYTREQTVLTHQGWFKVERIRVAEKLTVEFVLRRFPMNDDELEGDSHFLVVGRESAATGWSARRLRSWIEDAMKYVAKSTTPAPKPRSPSPAPPRPTSSPSARLSIWSSFILSTDPRSPRESAIAEGDSEGHCFGEGTVSMYTISREADV